MAKIATSAGHGGRDSGATGNGYLEKNINLEVTKVVNYWLTIYGHEVITYRNDDTDYGLTANERTTRVPKWSNENNVDYYIDIHFNAGGGTGVECYHSVKDSGQGSQISTSICKRVSEAFGFRNRGDKTKVENGNDYFGVIRNNNKKNSNLVECAFIDSSDDMSKYNSEIYGKAIADGICDVLGSSQPAQSGSFLEVKYGKWNIRTGPDKTIITTVSGPIAQVEYTSTEKGSDGATWYYVPFFGGFIGQGGVVRTWTVAAPTPEPIPTPPATGDEIAKLKAEIEALRQQINTLSNANAALTGENDTLKKDNETSSLKNNEYQTFFSQAKKFIG